jgi:hypothetical protein
LTARKRGGGSRQRSKSRSAEDRKADNAKGGKREPAAGEDSPHEQEGKEQASDA